MKKILLTISSLLFATCLYAQVGGAPRELTCTEEAFTFKTSIGSGWHFGQVSMGPSGLPKNMPDYIAVQSFNEATPEKGLPLTKSTNLQHTINLPIPDSLILPNLRGFSLDKFRYMSLNNINFIHYSSIKTDIR